MTGIIKILNKEKGFGFVEVKNLNKDLFFHATKVFGGTFEELEQGQEVTVEGVAQNEKGQYAVGITINN